MHIQQTKKNSNFDFEKQLCIDKVTYSKLYKPQSSKLKRLKPVTCLDFIAQLVEHRPFKAGVLGSSPSGVT